jgi:hypothetical protein
VHTLEVVNEVIYERKRVSILLHDGIECSIVLDKVKFTLMKKTEAPRGDFDCLICCDVSGSCEKTLIERNLRIVASQREQNLLCSLSKSGNKLVVICNYVWLN